jgi:hypothetical protein
MRIVTYVTETERQTLCDEARANGERLLHAYVRDGVKTLAFETPAPVSPAPRTRLEELHHQLAMETLDAVVTGFETVADFLEMLRLERGVQERWEHRND